MNKLKIGVIFGSRSTEHDVSIITAISSIIKPINLTEEYEAVPIYIDKSGRWYCDPALADINLYTKDNIGNYLAKLKPVLLELNGGFNLVKPGLQAKKLKIDVIFPATHGTHGEDGELMGMLDLINVPYVGSEMPASVLSMDKALAKIMADYSNIPTARFVFFYAKEFKNDQQAIMMQLKDLRFPLFVKPVHLGSSIAISRVTDNKALVNAIELAAHYDEKIIVEEAVNNLVEVTLPIMGNNELKPALLEQPLLKDEVFFDFNTKYMSGGKKGENAKQGAQGYSKLPADLPKKLYEEAEEIALKVYRVLGLKGIARVDLLIDLKAKKVYFNEVNPLPGSLYAHNWHQAGISSVSLVSQLIQLAQERYEEKKKLNTIFETNYLKQY